MNKIYKFLSSFILSLSLLPSSSITLTAKSEEKINTIEAIDGTCNYSNNILTFSNSGVSESFACSDLLLNYYDEFEIEASIVNNSNFASLGVCKDKNNRNNYEVMASFDTYLNVGKTFSSISNSYGDNSTPLTNELKETNTFNLKLTYNDYIFKTYINDVLYGTLSAYDFEYGYVSFLIGTGSATYSNIKINVTRNEKPDEGIKYSPIGNFEILNGPWTQKANSIICANSSKWGEFNASSDVLLDSKKPFVYEAEIVLDGTVGAIGVIANKDDVGQFYIATAVDKYNKTFKLYWSINNTYGDVYYKVTSEDVKATNYKLKLTYENNVFSGYVNDIYVGRKEIEDYTGGYPSFLTNQAIVTYKNVSFKEYNIYKVNVEVKEHGKVYYNGKYYTEDFEAYVSEKKPNLMFATLADNYYDSKVSVSDEATSTKIANYYKINVNSNLTVNVSFVSNGNKAYNISFDKPEILKINLESTSYDFDDEVVFSIPNWYEYDINSIKVMSNGNELKIYKEKNNYIFIMPKNDVTIVIK